MKYRVGSARLVGVIAVGIVIGASAMAHAQSQEARPAVPPPGQVQVGATQGGPTNELQPTPKFNMDYFHGEWEFEGALAESPLGEGGPVNGTETVTDVFDGRFWLVAIKGEGPEGPYTGNGVVIYSDGFTGQAFTRYEFSRGLPLLKSGAIGCDLGGNCNLYFETPPFERKGSLVKLRGRYYLTSPGSFRITTEISVDQGEYRNLGTVRYTKNLKAIIGAIK